MVSLLDVAKRAGVSAATVSRVLVGHAVVAEATRQRVLEAVRALGYQPNALASSLRRGRGRAVALVTGDIQQGIYAALAREVQTEFEAMDLDLILFNLGHREERLHALLQRSASLRLRAVLVAHPSVMDLDRLLPLISDTRASGVVVLSVSQRLDQHGVPSIVHDNASGAEEAVKYLHAQRRTPIAFVGRIRTSAVGYERFVGYRRGLAAVGAEFREELVLDSSDGYRAEAGHRAVSRALASGLRFGAVLAASDELALGGIAAVTDAGLKVPDDIGFIGFGGLTWAHYTRPALTTVSLDSSSLARKVSTIFRSIEEGTAAPALTLVAPKLIINASA